MYFSTSLSSSLGSEICMNYFILPNWLELNTVLNMIHVLCFHAARFVLVSLSHRLLIMVFVTVGGCVGVVLLTTNYPHLCYWLY